MCPSIVITGLPSNVPSVFSVSPGDMTTYGIGTRKATPSPAPRGRAATARVAVSAGHVVEDVTGDTPVTVPRHSALDEWRPRAGLASASTRPVAAAGLSVGSQARFSSAASASSRVVASDVSRAPPGPGSPHHGETGGGQSAAPATRAPASDRLLARDASTGSVACPSVRAAGSAPRGHSSRRADPFVGTVDEDLVLPDRHPGLDLVDELAAGDERIASMAARHGHDDRDVADGELVRCRWTAATACDRVLSHRLGRRPRAAAAQPSGARCSPAVSTALPSSWSRTVPTNSATPPASGAGRAVHLVDGRAAIVTDPEQPDRVTFTADRL